MGASLAQVAPAGCSLGVFFVPPWGALGCLLGRLGPPGGSPGAPREGPGGSPGGDFGNILAARPAHTKNFKKILIFYFYVVFFNLFFTVLLRRPRGAGARAHLEKIGFREECIAFFASRPLARGTKKLRK